MNLDTTTWTRILTEALSKPGTPDQNLPRPKPFDWADWATADWSGEQALTRLGVELIPWEGLPLDVQIRAEGLAFGRKVALNPNAPNKIRALAHELAHGVHGHTVRTSLLQVRAIPIEEFEADCTAMLVCVALELGDAVIANSRFYVQMYLKDFANADGVPLPASWEPIKRAAVAILAAGASTGHKFIVPPPPETHKQMAVAPVASFSKGISWPKRQLPVKMGRR